MPGKPVRVDEDQHAEAEALAARMTATDKRRTTKTDVVRVALAYGLAQLGRDYPSADDRP